MKGFFIIGLMLTLISAFYFINNLYAEGTFLFGSFIALIVGINYMIIAVLKMRQGKVKSSEN